MAVIKSRSDWPTVSAGGPDLVIVQIAPGRYQKMHLEDALRLGLIESEPEPEPEPKPARAAKRRRRASNKRRLPEGDKALEEEADG